MLEVQLNVDSWRKVQSESGVDKATEFKFNINYFDVCPNFYRQCLHTFTYIDHYRRICLFSSVYICVYEMDANESKKL